MKAAIVEEVILKNVLVIALNSPKGVEAIAALKLGHMIHKNKVPTKENKSLLYELVLSLCERVSLEVRNQVQARPK